MQHPNKKIVIIKKDDIPLQGGEIEGKFEVETIIKNYGTFEEDVSYKYNIDCLNLKLNSKPVEFNCLTFKDQEFIKNFIIESTLKV